MWHALGALLPIAVAVALSSVPITVTILILLSPNKNRAALPFLVGWIIGAAAVIALSALGAQVLPEVPRRAQKATAVLEIVIGLALMVLPIVDLRRRSRTDTAGLPRWLSAVDSFGPLVSFAVAVVLNFRPKGLLLGVAAGLALHAAGLNVGETAALIAIYTAIATSTVVIPIVASFLAPQRVEPRLVLARDWLRDNGRMLTSLIMFMIGVVIFGSGLAQL
jgi:Sap-like sulfolipid-1-addressing protein